MAAALRGLSQCTVILKEKNKKNKPKEFVHGMFDISLDPVPGICR